MSCYYIIFQLKYFNLILVFYAQLLSSMSKYDIFILKFLHN